MGIKFLCPNGHKLHVKSYLVGKKAICPKCGARVVVPEDGTASVDTQDESVSIVAETPSAAAQRDPPPSTSIDQSEGSPPPADPFVESPQAAWYVRPATGGQFGPAPGEIMRSWLNEGRIGAGSLVWRSGWSQWRTAAAVFPQLASSAAAFITPPPTSSFQPGNGQPAVASGILPVGHAVISAASRQPETSRVEGSLQTAAPPAAQTISKRRRQTQMALLVSAVLSVIIIILIFALVLIYRHKQAPAEKPVEDSSAATEVSRK